MDGVLPFNRAGDGKGDHARIDFATRDRRHAGAREGQRQRSIARIPRPAPWIALIAGRGGRRLASAAIRALPVGRLRPSRQWRQVFSVARLLGAARLPARTAICGQHRQLGLRRLGATLLRL